MSKTAISMKSNPQALKWIPLSGYTASQSSQYKYLHESSTSMGPSKEEEEGTLDPDTTTAASEELMESTDMKRLGWDDADDNGLRRLRLGMSCETEVGLKTYVLEGL
ncbi:hypothetical protein BU17DRAFT_86498 [Hysterangium stoloniferum]|nr:hypothetical protein BU17DRAFT_86498 [Hysterangium stoloniferum]